MWYEKKEFTNAFQQIKLYTYYSMNKQYREGVHQQQQKKKLTE